MDIAKSKKILSYILIFALFLCLLLINLGNSIGFVDESDNFLAGMTIADGGMVYTDFYSQHMPVLYYICAIFAKLGASNVIQFRLYFYIFFALLWTAFYIRYSNKIGGKTILLSVFLYISFICTELTSCVLSDQIQAFGMAVLLVEFIIFTKIRTIDIVNCVWISLAIFLSFGSAFVAIFGIFIIAVGVLGLEISEFFKSDMGIVEWIKGIFIKYWKLFAIVLLPFVVLIIYYKINGNLAAFYYGAYKINTDIYSKYTGGYGSNILYSFLVIVDIWFSAVKNAISGLASDTLQSIRLLLCFFVNIAFVVKVFRKNKYIAVILGLFCLACGCRSVSLDHHSMAYVIVTAFMASMLIFNSLEITGKSHENTGSVRLFPVICVVLFSTPLLSGFSSLANLGETLSYSPTEDVNNQAYYVSRLTDEEDKVLLVIAEPDIAVDANRLTVTVGVSTPWTYEAYGANDLANIVEENPKVVIYYPDYEIWGYKVKDYAPEVCSYIEENYIKLELETVNSIYVRNDLYDEAAEMFGLDSSDTATTGDGENVIALNQAVEQVFVAEGDTISDLRIKTGTYERVNNSSINVSITSMVSGTEIYTNDVSLSEFDDNEYNIITDGEIDVNEGEEYKITITPIGNTEDDYIAIYITDETDEYEVSSVFSEIDGYVPGEEYDYCIKFDYVS